MNGTLAEKEAAVRDAISRDFELSSVGYYNDCHLPEPDKTRTAADHWLIRLSHMGVQDDDLEFLYVILNPDPNQRLTAQEILDIGYLDVG